MEDASIPEYVFFTPKPGQWLATGAWLTAGFACVALGGYLYLDAPVFPPVGIGAALLAALGWIAVLASRKRLGRFGRIWKLRLFPSTLALYPVGYQDGSYPYEDLADCEVRYANWTLDYDHLEMILSFRDGAVLRTGCCKLRGDEVERAAEEIRARVRAFTDANAGSAEQDRSRRLEQFRRVDRISLVVYLSSFLLLTAVWALNLWIHTTYQKTLEEGVSVEGRVLTVREEAGTRTVAYFFNAPDGSLLFGTADYALASSPAPHEVGSPITIRCLPVGRRYVFLPADGNPKSKAPPIHSTLFLCLGWLFVIWMLLTGRRLVVCRKKVFFLRKGELEEDRLKDAARS